MLKESVDFLLYGLLGLDASLSWVGSIHFFIYDSIKIILLLFFMVSVMGFIRTYISTEKIKAWLSKKNYGAGNLIASLFGAVTPFCSCSSIPIFLSFTSAGVPLGVSFSFLITSPLVNEYLAVLMFGFFGWKITLAYIFGGIIIGTLAGIILGRLKLEKYIEKDISISEENMDRSVKYNSFNQRIMFGINEAKAIVKKLWLWILVGVGIGALVHNYVPSELIQSIVAKGGIFAVPLAVLLGVPMYASCAAILPVAMVLFQKGLPLGTALAFMMATSALSLPEFIILRRAMKLKLLMIFLLIVTIGIISLGYLYNFLETFLIPL